MRQETRYIPGMRITLRDAEWRIDRVDVPSHGGMLLTCGLFVLALVWAIFGKIDVVATAAGKIVPSGSAKVIQPIEIGAVRAIHVRNGQFVEKGDLLIELDPTLASADAYRT